MTDLPADEGQQRRAPSLVDVARAAGVSTQTVSRVANGLSNVQDDTRARVLEAMTTLGYRPNRAARALRSGRFHTFGVIVNTLSSYGNMHTLEAIADAAGAAGYALLLTTVQGRSSESVRQTFARLHELAVDGVIIIIESYMVERANVELPSGTPIVVIDSVPDGEHVVVDTDQAQGARLATEHLLSLGHPTVHHITGPSTSWSSNRREKAWRSTLEAGGRTVPEPFRGDWTAESGYRIGVDLARRSEVTAVFAGNDQMALGLLRAAHEAGRRVPESLSVVGFDDMPEAASFWPPLTTIRQRFVEVGALAVGVLLEEIHNQPAPGPHIAPTSLIVRRSTAPYRPDAQPFVTERA